MAEYNLAILLTAKDQASRALKAVNGELSRTGSIANRATKGFTTAARNIGAAAVGGFAILGVGVKAGLESLAELESAVSSVDGAIQQMGLAGRVSADQIATWANEIESDIGAAFDDKDITRATSTLIRFGKVTEENIRPAMEVFTDLAVRTGSVETAAELLAKALADPTKAAGKLSRYGIILTKTQQDQIKAFTKAGDAAAAQKVILDALAETTRGAARASQGEYARSLSTLSDVVEDAQRALAVGFLPVIMRVRDMLQKGLSDPKTMASIRELGESMAGALDSAIDIAEQVPWGALGSGLKVAADWAGKLMSVFTSLPKEVQTTIIALAGLNKLSGGAITGIVGELGKGLIKGVLGMTAGVVHLKAGTVIGGGGVGTGTGVGAGGGGGRVGGLVRGAGAAAGVGVAAFGLREAGDVLAGAVANGNDELEGQVKSYNEGILRGLGPLGQLAYLPDDIDRLINGQTAQTRQTGGMLSRTIASSQQINRTTQTGLAAVRIGLAATSAAIVSALFATRAKTTVNVQVTSNSVQTETTKSERYGPTSGSAGSGSNVQDRRL